MEIEVVLDEPPSRGPLSGLAAALNKIQTTHLLSLAVDLPRMTSTYLKELWACTQPGKGVIPQNGKFLESLCAIYPAERVTVAQAALSDKDVSLRRFVSILSAQRQIRF